MVITPTLSYASDTWTLSKEQRGKGDEMQNEKENDEEMKESQECSEEETD